MQYSISYKKMLVIIVHMVDIKKDPIYSTYNMTET